MADKIQLRRDTASNWSTQNPVLSQGELGAETDTLKIKMGDSTSTWNQLSYLIDTGNYATSAELTAAVSNLVDAAPGALDTLNELAAALGDDANFATTVTDAIALKATASTLSTVATTGAYADVTGTPTLSTVATTGAYADVTGTPALAAVATSGNYSSLSGRPSIPGVLTDLSITDGTVGQVLTTDGSGGFTFDDTSGGGSFEATASGTLANGDKVVVNADGTVSVVAFTTTGPGPGAETRLSSGIVSDYNNVALYDPTSNKVIITYGDTDNSNYITFVVGTVGTKTITFGTPVALSVSTWTPSLAYDPTSNKVVVAFFNPNNSWASSAVGTVSGNSISFGSVVEFYNGMISDHVLAIDTTSNKVVLAHTRNGVHAFVGTISGNSISFGSSTEIAPHTGTFGHLAVEFDSNAGKMVFAYHIRVSNTPYYGRVRVGTVSGNSITLGSELQFNDVTTQNIRLAFDSNTNKMVMTYVNAHVDYTGFVRVGTVSGNSISFGSASQLEVGKKVGHISSAIFNPNTNKVIITYSAFDAAWDDGTGRISFVTGTVSGTSISFTSPTIIVNEYNYAIATTVDTSTNQIILVRTDKSTNHEQVSVISLSSTTASNLTSENFVGISDGSYASGATATIQTSGAVDDAQSGLTAGQAYFLQEDGTLNTTPDTPRVFAGVALSATELMIGRDMSASSVVTYTDSDVATYLAGNGYDNASTIISTITDSAPATLDTLNELAAALGDDANFASTVTSSLALKADTTTVNSSLALKADTTTVNSSLALKADTSSLSTVATTGAYSDLTGTPAAVVPGGSFDAVASGTLANGDKVVVNADGTVSTAGMYPTAPDIDSFVSNFSITKGLGTSISIPGTTKIILINYAGNETLESGLFDVAANGTMTQLGSINTDIANGGVEAKRNTNIDDIVAYWDPVADKAVIAYNKRNSFNDYKPVIYGLVGTVSGNTLSWGSEQTLHIEANPGVFITAVAYDSTNNRSLVLHSGFQGSGTGSSSSIISLSGSTLSQTTPVDFFPSSLEPAPYSITRMAVSYVPAQGNYVISYSAVDYSPPTASINVVRTLAANGTTLGARTEFTSANNGEYLTVQNNTIVGTSSVIVRHSLSQATVDHLHFTIVTVSGSTITVGNSVSIDSLPNNHYDSNFDVLSTADGKVTAFWHNEKGSESNRVLYAADLAVTDGVLSIGTEYVISTASGAGSQDFFVAGVRNSTNDSRMVLNWTNEDTASNSSYFVVQPGELVSNITAENFVGISEASYSNGATATIQTAGSKDDAQSSLTAGQAYFLQGDGTLGTTPATPRVFAGVALSATELMIGRDMSASSVVTYTDGDVATYLTGNDYATQTATIAAITDSAPATLDTLNELAAALGDDANFASTVTASLGNKADTSSLSTVATSGAYADVTGTPTLSTVATSGAYADVTGTPTLSTVATSGAYSDLTGTPAAVVPGGSFDAVASGTLANGDKVVVNTDGTVSVVATGVSTSSLLRTIDNPNAYGSSSGDRFGRVAISGNYMITGASSALDAGGDWSGKAYIHNITSGALLHTLVNPNAFGTSADDEFGHAVAISGNYAVVGAHNEDDANGNFVGRAYIYNVTSGALLHTLDNPNPDSVSAMDRFGSAVAISGNYAIISAYGESDASNAESGKAYIFNVTSGALVHTLDNPNAYGTSYSDQFGGSVAISDTYAIVGTPYEDAPAEGSGDGTSSGRAYIFNVSSGALVRTIDNPNDYGKNEQDQFGVNCAISGNYAIFGVRTEEAPGGINVGKAYIFNVTTGALLHTLDNPNDYGTVDQDGFGRSVAISGTYAVVGASGEDDAGVTGSGRAYIYNVTTGALLQTIDNPNAYGTKQSDFFGANLAVSDSHIAIGATAEDDADGNNSGKVYVFNTPATIKNLTSENFVGIADGSYASGATATIQTAGSVDDAQSGLTAGQAYFVQADGTLGTTADSTRVFAGVALSATELMIGRDMSASSVVTYTDSDVATYLTGNGYTTQTATIAAGYSDSDVSTYLSGNGYDTATNIISTITDSAPGTLDTLNELAAALGDDANFASTVTSSLTLKANTSSLATVATSGAYADVTGTPTLATVATSGAYADVTGTPSLATVATSGAYSDLTGTPAAVAASGSFTATATGTLANGDKVVVNSDGTVSLAGASIIDTSSQGSGSAITFESNGTASYPMKLVSLDSSRFAMVYTDANTTYVKVVVGTISGSSITFGSTVVVESYNASGAVEIDKVAANKIVITYMTWTGPGGTGLPKLSVGTISGSSISMGSGITWPYATNGLALDSVSYNSTEDKILVVAPGTDNATNRARFVAAGTVSGNNITFGSLVQISTHAERGRYHNSVYDSTTNQTILSYQITGGQNYQVISLSGSTPTAHGSISLGNMAYGSPGLIVAGDKVVFTYLYDSTRKVVAGSIGSGSVSLGTPVSYTESGYAFNATSVAYDESMQKLVLLAEGSTDGFVTRGARANLASLSGTSITIDPTSFIVTAPTSDNNEMPNGSNTLTYDSVSGKFVYSYITNSMIDNGRTARIRTVSAGTASSHPLTAENFVGIADGAYASGATATIQTAGSVDDAQSGLTAGQAYFVQADGTIATTADSTRVFAGVAVSATELMIGRDMSASLATVATSGAYSDLTGSPSASVAEINHTTGVTSAIQTQLDAKLTSSSVIDGGGA